MGEERGESGSHRPPDPSSSAGRGLHVEPPGLGRAPRLSTPASRSPPHSSSPWGNRGKARIPPLSCSLSPSLPSACLSLPTAVVTPGCTPPGSPCTDPPCMDSPQHPASHTPIAPNGMECGTPKPSLELQGSVCPLLPPPSTAGPQLGALHGDATGVPRFWAGLGPPHCSPLPDPSPPPEESLEQNIFQVRGYVTNTSV